MIDAQGNELTITSSTAVTFRPKTRGRSSTKKFFISVDNLRLIGYSLDENDELFDPNTFNVVSHYWVGDRSEYALETLEWLRESEDQIVSLPPGRFKSEELVSKK